MQATFAGIEPHAPDAPPAPCALSSRKQAARGIRALFVGATARQGAGAPCDSTAHPPLAAACLPAGETGDGVPCTAAAAAGCDQRAACMRNAQAADATATPSAQPALGGARAGSGAGQSGTHGSAPSRGAVRPPALIAAAKASGATPEKRRVEASTGGALKKQRSLAAFLAPKR